jgi:glucose-1-phosphate thymidylyltransferase
VKVLVSLLPLETLYQPDRWPRPLGLWRLAGEPIAGHVLRNLHAILNAPSAELRFATTLKNSPLAAWVQEQYAGSDARMQLVTLTEFETVVQAAWQMRDWLAQDEPIWLLETGAILEAGFDGDHNDDEIKFLLPAADEDQTPAGIYIKSGKQLLAILSHFHDFPHAFDLQWLRDWLNSEYHPVEPITVGVVNAYTFLPLVEWIDNGWQAREQLLLQANARLLGLGSGSEDAIERSYVEDFTVLPPVYLHESAVIHGAVIGPYTSVAAGASIRSTVVSNSILSAGAQVSNVILDGAIIGEGAVVNGRADSLLLGDNQVAEK